MEGKDLLAALLIIMILVLSWYYSPYFLALLGVFLFSNHIIGGNSWECMDREADFCHKCNERSEDTFYRSRGMCEDICTFDYVHKGVTYKIKYPVPIDFLKSMKDVPKLTDFQNFITDQKRFSKIVRFISAASWNKYDQVYSLLTSIAPKNTYIVKNSFHAKYLNGSGYEKLIEEFDEIIRENFGFVEDQMSKNEALAKFILNDTLVDLDELVHIKSLIGTGKHYCTFINNPTVYFTERDSIIKYLKNGDANEVIIPLVLSLPSGFHANLLIYNKKRNQVFVFEPHVESLNFQDAVKKDGIQKFFKRHMSMDVEVISLRDYFSCPIALEEDKPFLRLQSTDALCSSWSVFAMLLHLYNKDVPIEAIYGNIMNVNGLPYLVKFLYYMEYQFKDKDYYHNFTVFYEISSMPYKIKDIHKTLAWILQM
jgi:hypothetical protein